MSKLVVMRGLPGSGKSTLARQLFNNNSYEESFILSADFGFHGDGKTFHFSNLSNSIDEFIKTPYKFNPKRLGHNHVSTFCTFLKIVADGYLKNRNILVILDNTNTQHKEFNHYVSVAQKLGFDIDYVLPDTWWAFDVEECAKRNTHAVPIDSIQKMKDRFQI